MGYRVEPGNRGVLIGTSGSGKSTLGTQLVLWFLEDYPKARVLLVDSKPRYRAEFGLNDLRVHYRGWVKGETLAGSVAIHDYRQLKAAFQRSRLAILQQLYPDSRAVPSFEAHAALAMGELFRLSNEERPSLAYVDEYGDLLSGGLAAQADRRIMRVIRAGRERNMASLFGMQRPVSVPVSTLTEANKFYVFFLKYAEDVKHMQKHGPPLRVQPTGFNFAFYEPKLGGDAEEKLMRVDIS